ncbi:MAG: hydantoinase B/oxoprolinase family protein [Deltaproteobacteria bacterium]|nr:hydantoinase B/oxoprolinase family protein [Deltaproteobacteria bacterium]
MSNTKLDPVKYELFYNKIAMILDESKEVLRYLSGSTITKEAGEVVQAFFNMEGEAVGMACGILIHIGAATRCIRYALDNEYDKPGIGIYDGDMFINNDAYIGGAHIPDTAVVAPVFYHDSLVGWTAGLSHTTEVGAIEPGGMCYTATEAVHEGLHMPMIKIIEKGQMRRDIFNMILRSTRDPGAMELDIRARIAGCERVKRRMNELIDEFGLEFFNAGTRQLLNDVEVEARERVKQLKPGVYVARTFNDTVGVKGDKPAMFQIEMEITEDGEVNIRTPVVSPQCDGYNNTYFAGIHSFILCTLLQTMFYNIRWNGGIMRVVNVEFPPHSRLNADLDRAVGQGTTSVMATFTSALTAALSRMFYISGKFDEVEAPYSGGPIAHPLAGWDRDGIFKVQVMVALDGYGSGGRLEKDGKDSAIVGHGNPWNYIPDTEGEEMVLPMLRLATNQRINSAGPGKFRGGLGLMSIVIFPHKGENCSAIGQGSGSRIPAGQGLWGGYPASRVYKIVCKNTDIQDRIKREMPLPHEIEALSSSLHGDCTVYPMGHGSISFSPGDILACVGHGGCGLGDPIERNPELIVEDVIHKRTTLELSQKIYGASINPETLKIDYDKTKSLRDEKRKERLRLGVPAKEYLTALVEKRNKKALNSIAQYFMEETAAFSPVYKEQLENEEILSHNLHGPIGKIGAKKKVSNLTPYVNIAEDEDRKIVTCNVCNFAFCEEEENYKLYCLIYERDTSEIHGDADGYPNDWCVYREFYCPGCGTQIDVETIVPGAPIVHDIKFNSG